MHATASRFGLCVVIGLVLGYGANRLVALIPKEVASPNRLRFELSLEPGEKIAGAVAGNLTNIAGDALVIGTWTDEGRGRVHILSQKRDHYEQVWSSAGSYGNFAGATIQFIGRQAQPVLITEWRNGNRGYLDVAAFKWDGRTYREIWDLYKFIDGGQLAQAAKLQVQRFDDSGDIQLVIRTPIAKPGEGAFGTLPHQVSIYRWDNKPQTFALFKRFVDPQMSWE